MTIDELELQRAALPDDERAPLDWPPMPLAELRERLSEHQQRRRVLDHRLATARSAAATISELAHYAKALDFLNEARRTLCDELLALPPRIRDAELLAKQRSIDLSIQVVDFGPGVLQGTGLSLSDIRLGDLMSQAGESWRGALPEVERMVARRAQAQSALDDALLDDDERAAREAAAKELRDAFNAMRVKVGPDGGGLVAYGPDGEPLDVSKMTPLQRRAFERMDAAFRR
jgi:hypothetical protein